MAGYAVEIAEFTIGDAYIGGIDVAIDLPGYLTMWNLLFTHFVGYKHQLSKWRLFKQGYAFLDGQELKIQGFGIQLVQLRSEEHTSELQSLRQLVCRLLLEKKKNHNVTATSM